MKCKLIIKIAAIFAMPIIINIGIGISHACDLSNHQESWVYKGDIGVKNIPISMALNFDKDNIKALYAYTNSTNNIALQGKVSDNNSIKMEEINNDDGSVKERFIGKFVEFDPRNKYGNSKLNCEVIVGEWYDAGSQQTHPFYLSLSSNTGRNIAHRYSSAGVSDDEIIHRAVSKLKSAIKKNDCKMVASMVKYPIKVKIEGNFKTLKNTNQLISLYGKIFTQGFKNKILKAHGRNLFAKSTGIMLDHGCVWFGANGAIVTLNN